MVSIKTNFEGIFLYSPGLVQNMRFPINFQYSSSLTCSSLKQQQQQTNFPISKIILNVLTPLCIIIITILFWGSMVSVLINF